MKSDAQGGCVPRLNVLFSYAYLRQDRFLADLLLALSPHLNILIDSGAFTNHRQGLKAIAAGDAATFKPITLDAYQAFCRQIDGKVWGCITLDRLGDPVTTRDNLDRLLDAGLKPIPVFVHGDAYDDVPRLLAINGRICVGSAVGARMDFTIQRYQRVFAASGGTAKIHALGFVKFPQVLQLPIASADSSAWLSGGRYGHIGWFNVAEGGLRSISTPKRIIGKPASDASASMTRFLLRCGLEPAHINAAELYRGTRGMTALSVINAYVGMHRYTEPRGRQFFFAVPSIDWVEWLIAVAACHRNDGSFDFWRARELTMSFGRGGTTPRTVDAHAQRLTQLLAEAYTQ